MKNLKNAGKFLLKCWVFVFTWDVLFYSVRYFLNYYPMKESILTNLSLCLSLVIVSVVVLLLKETKANTFEPTTKQYHITFKYYPCIGYRNVKVNLL